MIVANIGKVTELIEHRGSLQSAHEKALLYVAKGRYKIKRIVKTEVVQLWTDSSLVDPLNNPHRDIQRKIAIKPKLFLVGTENRIVASVMAGYDAHRGWINYLAMHPDHQDISNGRQIMAEVEDRLRAAGCSKINLQVRSTNSKVIEFYRRIGYQVDEVVSLGKHIKSE